MLQRIKLIHLFYIYNCEGSPFIKEIIIPLPHNLEKKACIICEIVLQIKRLKGRGNY